MFAIAKAVLVDAAKRKVVWLVAIFVALLLFAVPSLPTYDNIVVGSVYREVVFSLMFVAALSVGLGLGCTRVPAEVERRTVFSILARDVRRWHYIVATWLGIFAVVGLVVAVFLAAAIGVGAFIYKEVMVELAGAALAVWMETGVIMAVAMLATSRFGPVTSLVSALAFLFIGHSYGSILPQAVKGQWWVPTLDIFNVINPVAYGGGIPVAYIAPMSLAFLAWACLLLTAASASFATRDL